METCTSTEMRTEHFSFFVPYANEGGAITFRHNSYPLVQESHLVHVSVVIAGR